MNVFPLLLLLLCFTRTLAQPLITQQPQSGTNVAGTTATFAVVATGTEPLAYQWQKLSGTWSDLAGRTATDLVLTNVQSSDAGDYTMVATNWAGSVTSRVVTLNIDPTFTKITTGAIVTDKTDRWRGQAWADYDNDGDLDVLTITPGGGHDATPSQFNPIYRNNRDGTFTRTDVPSLQGYTTSANWWSTWGDYDNDGHLDLFIADASVWYYGGGGKNLLFHNNGNETFTRITNSPVGQEGGISSCGVWEDYDRDGDLDLIVANGAAAAEQSVRNSLYQNQGNGSFLRLTNAVTLERGMFQYPVWVDVDDDGWRDLFVTNPWSTNCLYRNLGPGGFIKVTGSPLVSEKGDWFAVAWADYDNDGDSDVFLTQISWPESATQPVALYRNEGTFHFIKTTTNDVGPLANERLDSWSCAWGDYDNDGWIDLFAANGYSQSDGRKCVLYRNNGDGTFAKITTGSLVNDAGATLSAQFVDYDQDGFLDLFATGRDGNVVNRLYRNNGNSNNWLCIQCVGTSSPRWGTGAKVRVQATIRGRSIWQLRLIDAGGSSWGGQSFVAHFGLGDATVVDTLRIEWTSGIVQELHNLPVRQYLTATEPARLAMPQAGVLHIQCWKDMAYAIETSPDLAIWTPLATVTNPNLTGGIHWTEPTAPAPSTRFYRAAKR